MPKYTVIVSHVEFKSFEIEASDEDSAEALSKVYVGTYWEIESIEETVE